MDVRATVIINIITSLIIVIKQIKPPSFYPSNFKDNIFLLQIYVLLCNQYISKSTSLTMSHIPDTIYMVHVLKVPLSFDAYLILPLFKISVAFSFQCNNNFFFSIVPSN
jgi:hypothetical protein